MKDFLHDYINLVFNVIYSHYKYLYITHIYYNTSLETEKLTKKKVQYCEFCPHLNIMWYKESY